MIPECFRGFSLKEGWRSCDANSGKWEQKDWIVFFFKAEIIIDTANTSVFYGVFFQALEKKVEGLLFSTLFRLHINEIRYC